MNNNTTNATYTCIFCRCKFSQAPAEHILQNSLGTTWTCNSFMCPQCQSFFGSEPDVAVGEFSTFFRNILNIGTGREPKKVPTIPDVTDANGHEYILLPGCVLELKKPYFEALEDSIRLITSKRTGQEEWCRHIVEKAGYTLGEEIQRSVESEGVSRIHAKLGFSFLNFGIALLKSALNLIGVNDANIALHPSFDELRNELLTQNVEKCQQRVFCIPAAALPYDSYALCGHQMYVFSIDNQVSAVIRLFGGVTFQLNLSHQYEGHPFCFVYVADPLRLKAKLVTSDYNPKLIEQLLQQPSPDMQFGNDKFYECVQQGYELFMYKSIANNYMYPLLMCDSQLKQPFFSSLFQAIMPAINGQIFYELTCGSFFRFEGFMKQVIQRMHDIIKETDI